MSKNKHNRKIVASDWGRSYGENWVKFECGHSRMVPSRAGKVPASAVCLDCRIADQEKAAAAQQGE